MKLLLYVTSLLLWGSLSKAQEKTLQGMVKVGDFSLSKIEIINSTQKKSVQTNAVGTFTIPAVVGDVLIVFGPNYIPKKITLTPSDFEHVMTIELVRKNIELDEIVVQRGPVFKVDMGYNAMKQAAIQNAQERPKPVGVYTGEMTNGVDFIAVGKMLFSIFKNKDKADPKVPLISFKSYVQQHFTEDYLQKTLQLNTSQLNVFLDFCQDDPKAALKLQQNGPLDVLEFLLEKRKTFLVP